MYVYTLGAAYTAAMVLQHVHFVRGGRLSLHAPDVGVKKKKEIEFSLELPVYR
jgi:hypothetical protein